jgi:hypothetical protein
MTFETFMAEIEAIFQREIGMSYLDMPDWCYYDSFEDGLTPQETYEDWAAEYWPGA